MKLSRFPSFLILPAFFMFILGYAQNKPITIEEIWNGTFQTTELDELRSMKNGLEYTVLKSNPTLKTSAIVAFEYMTQKETQTIVSADGTTPIPYFTSYEFSADESLVLLATEEEPLFRRSTRGIYYVYDRKSRELLPVSTEKIREPSFSPDNRHVAYVFENNIYIFNIRSRETRKVTTDGVQNHIINGVTDWVYEEEFAFVQAYEWNSTGDHLAFLRFDESGVPEFSMDIYGYALYPWQHQFKYPKAGEPNAFVSLHLYQLPTEESHRIPLEQDYYIPRIQWMNNPRFLTVQTLNRQQNRLHLYRIDAGTRKAALLFEETDEAYVEVTDLLHFLGDDRFLWTSERDGYNHIYLYGSDGQLIRQLTRGEWEVTDLYGHDPKKDFVYFQSTENGSINRDIYRINTMGKSKGRLSAETGTHQAAFSADYTVFIDTFSNSETPPRYTLHNGQSGKKLRLIKDNSDVLQRLENYQISPKEYSTISINGNDLNMWMVKPYDFDSSKEYPLLLFQYSGPGSQEVANIWMEPNDYWHQVLASEGYMIACVDGRGTGYKGRDFKKVTYKELGKYEVQDQIESARKLSELPYIDASRTGIWGWSYGGFMASNCLFQGGDTFELGIAVAPVTSWRFYDTIYTERYMRTPKENPSGYDRNSPLYHAGELKGDYLLIHGSGDDNVHVQNSMQMVNALVQANKQFEWAIYPDRNHGISGGNTRLHLYTLMTNFLREHLKAN